VPFTRGFPSRSYLIDKFDKHVAVGQEFDVATEDEYERRADTFLGGELNPQTTREGRRRSDGAKLRYNEHTEEFGILSVENVIVTYFKPDPAIHGKANNLQYFYAECRR